MFRLFRAKACRNYEFIIAISFVCFVELFNFSGAFATQKLQNDVIDFSVIRSGKKSAIVGVVERDGDIRVKHIAKADTAMLATGFVGKRLRYKDLIA